ncbi:MAG: phosphoribosylaminoimidazolesuccinocarboxamide synthase [Bacteroidales bacterium]|nr:phosphoribosylaminoimidazolesuccinocarboxamide synthase [Bacteroidales bacterium]
MSENEVIYNGESVKIFGTGDPEQVLQRFTDNITAFKKIKKAVIKDKGMLCCSIASKIFSVLERGGVPTHFIRQVSDCEMLCRRAEIFRIEVIVRNVIAGTMARELGLEEGMVPQNLVIELCYSDESLNDPLINDSHALALGLVSKAELKTIYTLTERINEILKPYFADRGIILVDFKLQFGRLPDGKIVLADEITPDSARFWDAESGERLDKDRFRRDLGHVSDAYREVYNRILRD